MAKKETSDTDSAPMIADAIIAMNQLEPRIRTAAKQYKQIKDECESKVKEWRWATAEMNHLRLLSNERARGRRGRWSKKPPKESEDCFEYGYDSNDRLLMIQQVGLQQIFFVYEDDYVEALCFSSEFLSFQDIQGIKILRQSTLKNVPIDCAWYAAHQRGFEAYKYNKSGNLIGIDATWTNQPHTDEDILSAQYEASYDDSGALVLLTVDYRAVGRHRGGSFTCYKKRVRK